MSDVQSFDEASARLEYHAGNGYAAFDVPSFVAMPRPYAGLHQAAYDDVTSELSGPDKAFAHDVQQLGRT